MRVLPPLAIVTALALAGCEIPPDQPDSRQIATAHHRSSCDMLPNSRICAADPDEQGSAALSGSVANGTNTLMDGRR
jgi:hypothetical protein